MERPHLKQKKFPQLVQVILLQPSDFWTAILQLGHCFASLLIYSMFRTSLINSFSFLKASSPINLPFCRPCNFFTTTEINLLHLRKSTETLESDKRPSLYRKAKSIPLHRLKCTKVKMYTRRNLFQFCICSILEAPTPREKRAHTIQ